MIRAKFLNGSDISVVIPAHDRPQSLQRLIASLDCLKDVPREVIVVDDGSQDATRGVLDQWQSRPHRFAAIAFPNPVAQGPGKARNIGVQLASGTAVAFTDDDCVVHPKWIRTIAGSKIWAVNAGFSGENAPVAGIGGRVLPFRVGIVSAYFTFHRILEPPRYNQYLVTANACYLRAPLVAVGGFDDGHRFPGGEDNALSFKLSRAGYQFGYEQGMVVWHDYRTSLPAFARTFFQYGKGCAEVTRKYLGHLVAPIGISTNVSLIPSLVPTTTKKSTADETQRPSVNGRQITSGGLVGDPV